MPTTLAATPIWYPLCRVLLPTIQRVLPGQMCTSRPAQRSSSTPMRQQQISEHHLQQICTRRDGSPLPCLLAPGTATGAANRGRPDLHQSRPDTSSRSPLLLGQPRQQDSCCGTAGRQQTPSSRSVFSAASELVVLPIHAIPSPETSTVTFPSVLATPPCSPLARNRTTATMAATRPTTRTADPVSDQQHKQRASGDSRPFRRARDLRIAARSSPGPWLPSYVVRQRRAVPRRP